MNLWSSIGGLVATLSAGILMSSLSGSLQSTFFVPIMAATIFGIISSLVMLSVKEGRSGEKLNLRGQIKSDILGIATYVKKTPNFLKYCYVAGTFEFFMSISWPLFTITQVKVLNVSTLDLAVLSIVQTIVTVVFQGWAGRLADTAGRKPLLVFFRFALVTVPIVYAVVPDVKMLIIISTFWGFAQALGTASVTAYLLDVAPEAHRGSFTALFNLILGVVSFFGSLIGGYLSDYTIGLFGLVFGLQVVYLISIFGRGIGAASYLTLEETLKRRNP
jgi:MFS family permease